MNTRFILAFLAAPCIFPLLLTLLWLAFHPPRSFEPLVWARNACYEFFTIAAVAYPATVVFGMPCYQLVEMLHWRGKWSYIVGAALIGIINGLLFTLLISKGHSIPLPRLRQQP